MTEKTEFYTAGTEAFSVAGKKAGDTHLILNIQESKDRGILLDRKKTRRASSGNLLFDFYYAMNNYLIEHSTVKIEARANFFHLLAVMLNSGIPMVKALRSLVEQTESSPRLKMIIEDLVTNVEGGSSLSEAMLVYPDVFSEQEVGMVQSGEVSGQLVKVLENLSVDTEKAYSIRAKVKGAMMYPMVIFMLLIAVISAMMIFVVPKLTDLFSATGNQLPLITRVVIGISDFLVNYGLVLLAGMLGLVLLGLIFRKTDMGKYAFDKFKISMPLFGKLFKKAYLSRFARSLSNLLDSGVSIVKTLEITANSVGNDVYRRRLMLAMEDIKQGIPLAENMSDSDLFPPMLVSMVEVGEKTARLDEIMGKVARFYEDEVDTYVNGLSKILEPLILIVMGLSVGAVVAAVMLPIMQLSNLAGQF
ncbi:MAG: type II secretion system F family protein [Candidatus Gracilibacteria bacterium]